MSNTIIAGDRVRHIETGELGTVHKIEPLSYYMHVQWDQGGLRVAHIWSVRKA